MVLAAPPHTCASWDLKSRTNCGKPPCSEFGNRFWRRASPSLLRLFRVYVLVTDVAAREVPTRDAHARMVDAYINANIRPMEGTGAHIPSSAILPPPPPPSNPCGTHRAHLFSNYSDASSVRAEVVDGAQRSGSYLGALIFQQANHGANYPAV